MRDTGESYIEGCRAVKCISEVKDRERGLRSDDTRQEDREGDGIEASWKAHVRLLIRILHVCWMLVHEHEH